jgi:PadR family transcriptional regulator PadR
MRVKDESRQSQLLRGVLDACLLAVIAARPAYGYEMTKRLSDAGLDAVGEGSIYPVLGRLQHAGLVETFLEPSNGGPPRKYYRASKRGQEALKSWREDWRRTRVAVDAVLDTAHKKG